MRFLFPSPGLPTFYFKSVHICLCISSVSLILVSPTPISITTFASIFLGFLSLLGKALLPKRRSLYCCRHFFGMSDSWFPTLLRFLSCPFYLLSSMNCPRWSISRLSLWIGSFMWFLGGSESVYIYCVYFQMENRLLGWNRQVFTLD